MCVTNVVSNWNSKKSPEQVVCVLKIMDNEITMCFLSLSYIHDQVYSEDEESSYTSTPATQIVPCFRVAAILASCNKH